MSDTEYTPTLDRIRDLYGWSVAWRADQLTDRPDLERLRERQFTEFDDALSAYTAGVRAETLAAAQDHLLGEDDPEWAREAHGSSVSYPTVMEALDATRDDFDIRGGSHE